MLVSQQQNTLSITHFNNFIEYVDASKKTVQTYTRALRQFYYWLLDNKISQPTRNDIVTYRDELLQDKKPTTVASYLTAIKQFFKWTSQEGIYKNVAENIKQPKQSKEHKKDYLTANQVKQILNSIDTTTTKGKRDYILILLGVTSGLRTIELSRLNVEDLAVNGNQSVLYIQGKGKQDKSDFIAISEGIETVLRGYIAENKLKPNEPLFQSTSNNNKGGRMTTRAISQVVKDYLVLNGFDSSRLTAHSLRHTAVTLALLQGLDLQEVQQFARHSNITTTQIYAHNLEKSNNQCNSAIANAIFN